MCMIYVLDHIYKDSQSYVNVLTTQRICVYMSKCIKKLSKRL